MMVLVGVMSYEPCLYIFSAVCAVYVFFLGKGFRSTKISRVSLMHCDSLLDEGQMICIRAITSNTTTVKTWLSHKKGLVINP